MNLRIVADQNIYLVEEAFSTIGEVHLADGSLIDAALVADADLLVTRTTTKVNPSLLAESAVCFVATATSGTDHIDLPYLKQKGIGFASAAGCNANAVAEFVINALLNLPTLPWDTLEGKVLGIVGAGHAGSALKKKAECLGIRCLLNDPPLAQNTPDSIYIELEALLSQSDIISFHVPLTHSGPFKTWHLLDNHVFERIKPGTVIVNASRGGVIDEQALSEHRSKLGGVILDVWEQEPDIDSAILALADIATPHIAGYSLDGKIKATEIAYLKTCHYLDCQPRWESPRVQANNDRILNVNGTIKGLGDLLRLTYDIFSDDHALRKIGEQEIPAHYFRSLRNTYRFRHEFSNYRIPVSSI
jgi:erythronate-4-phosphate dehydrogenase